MVIQLGFIHPDITHNRFTMDGALVAARSHYLIIPWILGFFSLSNCKQDQLLFLFWWNVMKMWKITNRKRIFCHNNPAFLKKLTIFLKNWETFSPRSDSDFSLLTFFNLVVCLFRQVVKRFYIFFAKCFFSKV